MNYNESDVLAATARMDKYRADSDYEVGVALVVLGLSSERASREIAVRDDMIRTAHRSGASLEQIADASRLDREAITTIAETDLFRA